MDDAFEYDFNRAQFLKEAKTPENLEKLKSILKLYFRKM